MVTKREIRVHSIKRYGWVPDLPDARDHMYAAPVTMVAKLPAMVDLRPQCPPPYDQGQLGSCTGNAIAGAVQFDREKQHLTPDFVPSRLFIYYGERVIEGTVGTDSGAQIRDGIKVVANQGVPPETDRPYDITKFADKPPPAAFGRAEGSGRELQQAGAKSRPDEGMPGFRLPVRVRFHGLRKLRKPTGGADRGRADAGCRRERTRRSRGDRRGLRRQPTALHRAQLLGHGLGHAGLLHHALRLPDGTQSLERLLDHPAGPELTQGRTRGRGARGSVIACTCNANDRFSGRFQFEAAGMTHGDVAFAARPLP